MKKIKIVITGLLLLGLMLSGCSKEKPKEGYYEILLKYDMPSSIPDDKAVFEITESAKGFIRINTFDRLEKKGRNISGTIESIGTDINGKWSYDMFKKKYYIKGTFARYIVNDGLIQEATGTFEMKSLN